ncbi:hypothetical protein QQY24_03375 [Streptomyces sp. TG1A-8]|uniref:hypothetical protein n=1 Tax=Streptomyces sp. TG1A-8 TaxID=3051385 RepID=UPI00265C6F33|nr:hypothetical protein [Streptomyces sp. TG1A-8]MDO0924503.1 hypothetical protein [Streptomyces sp. TG1A-8]
MIPTRRIVAAVALAVGLSALVAPLANAAGAGAPHSGRAGLAGTLDPVDRGDASAENQTGLPRLTEQLQGLVHLRDLDQLNRLTGPVAPATGLLPGLRA